MRDGGVALQGCGLSRARRAEEEGRVWLVEGLLNVAVRKRGKLEDLDLSLGWRQCVFADAFW